MNKKYFLVVLAMLGTQCILGINFVNAMQCEKEIEQEWASQNTHVNPDGSRVVFTGNDTHKMDSLDEVKSAIYDEVVLLTTQNPYEGQRGNWGPYTNFKSCEEHVNNSYQGGVYYKQAGKVCITKYIIDNNCKNLEVFKYKKGSGQQSSSSNSSSNQSGSGSSSQSNKKANRQSANNQSSSSSSSDLSNKSQEQLFEILDSAENRGDYAQAYAAEKQLAKDPSAFIKRQALRRTGYRLAEGRGVKQNLNEARKYFEQAAGMGDLDASANLCVFNILGKGGA